MAVQICSVSYNPKGGNAAKKYFKASKTLYTDSNKADTGITPETETNQGTTPLYDTGELMRAGYLERVNVSVKVTETTRTTYRIFCSPEKKAALILKYNGNQAGTLNGKQVIGASAGVRRANYKL